ncbi:MAG: hypothetical protein SAJ37_10820 [Oscillatoria sp. PMC 1068.18]|nr:hypothetical protein [Oscillatoria sp. PMC 1076.18]MEC4989232.1 hypothetical protein [Oscillatoria sp. PMC 1068.18]
MPYDSIITAFASVGIDAVFDETTPEVEFENKITRWNNLTTENINQIKRELLNLEKQNINSFVSALVRSLSRRVENVTIVILHGQPQQINSLT